jgi:hypothetical protein
MLRGRTVERSFGIREEKTLKDLDRGGKKRDGMVRRTKGGGLLSLRMGMMLACFQITERSALDIERL